MKIRKGVVPLILVAILAAGWAIYTFGMRDRVPMENGESAISLTPH
jgi:hypothetical protein